MKNESWLSKATVKRATAWLALMQWTQFFSPTGSVYMVSSVKHILINTFVQVCAGKRLKKVLFVLVKYSED